MDYEAPFLYSVQTDKIHVVSPANIFVSSFSVLGGASRTINLNATTDFSISSELHQARQYKNITLFMSPTDDGKDMQVAMELTEYAIKKAPMLLNVYIEKWADGKIIELLTIADFEASIKHPPRIVANRLLMIEVSLPSAYIRHGESKGNGGVDSRNMSDF